MQEPTEHPSKPRDRMRNIAYYLVLIGAVIYGGAFFLGGSITMLSDPALYKVALEHFPATVGLPSSALASLFIVVFLEQSSGAIEFECIGFKFKEASGPIVLWVVVFLSIAFAIKMLW